MKISFRNYVEAHPKSDLGDYDEADKRGLVLVAIKPNGLLVYRRKTWMEKHMPKIELVALALALVLLAITSPAFSADYIVNKVKDRHGLPVGTIEQRPDGQIVIKDRHGIKTGTIESKDGKLIVKDRWGLKQKEITK